MSIIPDCRPKYKKDCEIHQLYPPKKEIPADAINPYWYGLLEGEDKEFLAGYDWNAELVIANMFDNLDTYADKLAEVGIDVCDIDNNIVNGALGYGNINFNESFKDERENKWYEEYTDVELSEMNDVTKLMLVFKSILFDYIEHERDMIVTSMIEHMDDEAHKKAMEQVKENK